MGARMRLPPRLSDHAPHPAPAPGKHCLSADTGATARGVYGASGISVTPLPSLLALGWL
jgi:hypothetical protein